MKASVRHEPPARPVLADRLVLDELEPGRWHRLLVKLVEDAAGRPIRVPVVVARGAAAGPTVGLTAAIHGNEVNGVPTIHRLCRTIEPADLKGAVVGVPIANLPAYELNQRDLPDGQDLNRLFPGRPDGDFGLVYAHHLLERIVGAFDVLLDLHTASFGRVNTLYVRADMTRPDVAELARLLCPQIIVHGVERDTLRGAAQARGICAVTLEIGNPQELQAELIDFSRIGLRDVIEHLGLLESDTERAGGDVVECARSYWLHTDAGGLLEVLPDLAEPLAAGDPVARLTNEWGDLVCEYRAPEAGVVVGKSTNPVAHTGARVLHLGIPGAPARA